MTKALKFNQLSVTIVRDLYPQIPGDQDHFHGKIRVMQITHAT